MSAITRRQVVDAAALAGAAALTGFGRYKQLVKG
jgi:hypothetical protein